MGISFGGILKLAVVMLFALGAAISIVRALRRRKMICPACQSRKFDRRERCLNCGRKEGEGFEVIPSSKDQ